MNDKSSLEVLREYWGYDSFRPKQQEIVDAALDGRDVLAILPTGGGKSVCFQVPAMMREGLAIVVTPLIALMKDQVQNLCNRGIRAIAVHAGMNRHEVDLALNNAAYGDYKFLYISPERLGTSLFRSYLSELNVNFIVVDEAHCISQWGYDFRPDYLNIGRIREFIDAPVIALTATATPEVADDIMTRLGFTDKLLIKSGFERPNLTYVVRRTEDKMGQLLSVCKGVPGTGIVYVRNRRKTEELAGFLNAQGITASFYHAGLGHQTRTQRQEAWKCGEIRVMACTNAFGMGIDKPDVRFVAHYDLPDSPEAYFQEAGRAGRDGKRSYAVLLWNGTDITRAKQMERVSFPPLEYIADIYQKVHAFLQIPYNAGEMRQAKFDFKEFCRRFSLEQSTAYYAIKYIERENHWTYSEDVDVDTRVKIIVDRNDLYDITFTDERMAPLLELLMRRCVGIFSFPVAVDEEFFAAVLGITVPLLRQLLYRLSVEHVINYIPCDHADVLLIHHNRLEPGNVALSPKRYEQLKASAHKRMEAMQEYAAGTEICRSRYLLAYFGQKESEDCETCDVCRARPSGLPTRRNLKYFVHEHGGRYTLEDVRVEYGTPSVDGSPEWLVLLREMIDDGEIPPPID